MSTFGPEGPEKCSGLDIVRYDSENLHGQFGKTFKLINSTTELHQTPMGTTQQFLYCFCRMKQIQASSALVDSAPGHQETLKPPSGGFSVWAGGAWENACMNFKLK